MPDKCVYIVDDDAQLRGALEFLCTTSQIPTRTFGDGREFLDDTPNLAPGCVLLDVRMPRTDGLETLEALQPFLDKFAVIMMTGYGDVCTAVKAMKMGAVDFIEKPFIEEVLVSTVLQAHVKGKAKRTETEAKRNANEKIARLTPREKEVLHHLMGGLTNKVVAQAIGVSPRTVEMHRSNMIVRLGANSLSDAVRIACTAGLLPSGG